MDLAESHLHWAQCLPMCSNGSIESRLKQVDTSFSSSAIWVSDSVAGVSDSVATCSALGAAASALSSAGTSVPSGMRSFKPSLNLEIKDANLRE